jgi:hypothetical protein
MKLTFDILGLTYPGCLWKAQSDSHHEFGATPFDAVSKLADKLAKDLGISGPELLAETRLNPFGDNMYFPWVASAGDGAEGSGPDPLHAMYLLCEQLETALEEQNESEESNA